MFNTLAHPSYLPPRVLSYFPFDPSPQNVCCLLSMKFLKGISSGDQPSHLLSIPRLFLLLFRLLFAFLFNVVFHSSHSLLQLLPPPQLSLSLPYGSFLYSIMRGQVGRKEEAEEEQAGNTPSYLA